MNKNIHILKALFLLMAGGLLLQCGRTPLDDPRVIRGRSVLESTLGEAGQGHKVDIIYVIDNDLAGPALDPNGETFAVTLEGDRLLVKGTGPAGLLYGSLEAAGRIREIGSRRNASGKDLKTSGFEISESPKMNLRGVGLLLMKLGTYNYPITRKEFPFFYDRDMWIEYLDFLEANRFNYIAFWNGHPFSYFADLPEYREAQDGMPEGTLDENQQQLNWLIREAGRRNIRLFFEFYNIHTSVYFQKHHHLPEEIREPDQLLADYTAYCIEHFCRQFPEVGLYITAGEGLNLEHSDEWVNGVIMPAIERAGAHTPVFLRAWFLDMDHARKITVNHPDIYIERKFNVEMIAGTRIDPAFREWDQLTGQSVVNIHMAANLEPFRWNPPDYIRKCMQNSLKAGAEGIHLYPRKSWRWPYGSDLGKPTLQWERDRLWYEMWGRYAWDPDRDSLTESVYWTGRISGGTSDEDVGGLVLKASELSADILPAIQRLFWAGHDNHTVVTSGLLISQIELAEGIPFLPLDPVIPVSEFITLTDPPPGGSITPDAVLSEKIREGEMALDCLDEALSDPGRLENLGQKTTAWVIAFRNDVKAMVLTAQFYREKLRAAHYQHLFLENPGTFKFRDRFLESLDQSVEIFERLTGLMEASYESLSDVPAVNPVKLEICPYHWRDLLPVYQRESEIYRELMSEIGGQDFSSPVYEGLTGIWFGDPGFKNPRFSLGTDRIEYVWNRDDQKPEGGRNWSAQWFGSLVGPSDAEIWFLAEADQTVRVRIGDVEVIEREYNNNPQIDQSSGITGMMKMKEGKVYPIIIEYDHAGMTAGHISLKWKIGDGDMEQIPGYYFKHSRADQFRVDRMLIRPESAYREEEL